MEESFARVETKYMLTPFQTRVMEQGLLRNGFRPMDFGCPTVQSLYYDTPDRRLIRASLERPAYKEKLRLRVYGYPDSASPAYVEVKKKYRGVVYKRRVRLPLEAAAVGLEQGRFSPDAGQVGREALWMVRHYGLIPSAVILCDRGAWFRGGDTEVRVTFDRNIAFRGTRLDLTQRGETLPLTTPDQILMEIKTGRALPLWLVRLLEEAGAHRVHFSKYGLAWQTYLSPGSAGRIQPVERSEIPCGMIC